MSECDRQTDGQNGRAENGIVLVGEQSLCLRRQWRWRSSAWPSQFPNCLL